MPIKGTGKNVMFATVPRQSSRLPSQSRRLREFYHESMRV